MKKLRKDAQFISEPKDSALKCEIFGYGDKCTNEFEDKEISQLVWDVLDLIHEYDWYSSGDTGEEDYLKAKMEFKNKWLSNNKDERTKELIDKTIEEAKQELYKTFLNYQILSADFAEKK